MIGCQELSKFEILTFDFVFFSIGNLIYTIVGEPFKIWIDEEIKKRNEKIMSEHNMAIEMDPEVYKAFQESQHVSV